MEGAIVCSSSSSSRSHVFARLGHLHRELADSRLPREGEGECRAWRHPGREASLWRWRRDQVGCGGGGGAVGRCCFGVCALDEPGWFSMLAHEVISSASCQYVVALYNTRLRPIESPGPESTPTPTSQSPLRTHCCRVVPCKTIILRI